MGDDLEIRFGWSAWQSFLDRVELKDGEPRVKVSDLLTVFPELARDGESNLEFAEKIVRAAEWNRGNEADSDLISRLYPDMVDELQQKREGEGGN